MLLNFCCTLIPARYERAQSCSLPSNLIHLNAVANVITVIATTGYEFAALRTQMTNATSTVHAAAYLERAVRQRSIKNCTRGCWRVGRLSRQFDGALVGLVTVLQSGNAHRRHICPADATGAALVALVCKNSPSLSACRHAPGSQGCAGMARGQVSQAISMSIHPSLLCEHTSHNAQTCRMLKRRVVCTCIC